MKKETLRRVDLVFSIVLMIIAAGVFIQSIGLFFNPFGRDFARVRPEDVKESIVLWYHSPALMPLLLSVVLFICAVYLKKNAQKEGAKLDFIKWEKVKALFSQRETWVVIIVSAILCLYVFLLIPVCRTHLNFFPRFQGFPFMIATFLFLALMMVAFNEKSIKKILTSLAVAAVTSGLIAYGFGVAAMIPLP